jgi:hypothetical protein
MPLGEMLKNARDKYTDAMSSAERLSIGVNERAKRLKQAMFPQESQPGEVAAPRDPAAAQDNIDRENRQRERRKRR